MISRLGGRAHIEKSARETRAFLRARGIEDALVLLRLILAYCLGGKGLRLTAAWAASLGVADISNVALLYRLRQCGDWLSVLAAPAFPLLAPRQPKAGPFASWMRQRFQGLARRPRSATAYVPVREATASSSASLTRCRLMLPI